MKPLTKTALLAGCLTLAAGPAALAQPEHCPPGHERQGRCEPGIRYDQRGESDLFFDRSADREQVEDAYRAGYEDGRRDGFRAGQRLPDNAQYRVIRDYDRYGLTPPRDGYYYAEMDDEVLLIRAATQVIAEALGPR